MQCYKIRLSLMLVCLAFSQAGWAAGYTERVSIPTNGSQDIKNDEPSYYPAISADGTMVAFASAATNLVDGDTNSRSDIFIRNRQNGHTVRVSKGPGGAQANGGSYDPVISANGRFVAFQSSATNLVPGTIDTNLEIYVYDRSTATTTRVSDEGFYKDYPTLSADGCYVAFVNNLETIEVRDRCFGRPPRLLQPDWDPAWGDRPSLYFPKIGSNGRQWRLVFESTKHDDSDPFPAIYFASSKEGSAPLFIANGDSPTMSADGSLLAFASPNALVPGDSNGKKDIYVYDINNNSIERISTDFFGAEGNGDNYFPALSADGRRVAFLTEATNYTLQDGGANTGDNVEAPDLVVHYLDVSALVRASVNNASIPLGKDDRFVSLKPVEISANGQYVAFDTDAWTYRYGSNDEKNDDIFVRDLLLQKPGSADVRISRAQANKTEVTPLSELRYDYEVVNLGPDEARGVTLISILSERTKLIDVVPQQGSCTLANVMVCRLGKLATGSIASVSVRVKVLNPTLKTALENYVTVSTLQEDLDKSNDRKKITVPFSE